jgi:aspartyl/asparaginyl-tRNA synthetase
MIDYDKIGFAVAYYGGFGFKYIDAPWIVSEEAVNATAPVGVRMFTTFAGELVASGEQSFIEMRKELLSAPGFPALFQCVTPCFRDELVQDQWHLQYFMKNELIAVCHPTHDKNQIPWAAIDFLIRNALSFYKKFVKDEDAIQVVKAPQENSVVNTDILINGIEVGSYGYRYYDDFCWAYGTGIAEPRFSQAVNYFK